MSDDNDKPEITVPVLADLHAEGGLEAVWNAAVEACLEISGWSAFWDDGRSAGPDMQALLIPAPSTD